MTLDNIITEGSSIWLYDKIYASSDASILKNKMASGCLYAFSVRNWAIYVYSSVSGTD
jgi:hypothetical protein